MLSMSNPYMHLRCCMSSCASMSFLQVPVCRMLPSCWLAAMSWYCAFYNNSLHVSYTAWYYVDSMVPLLLLT